MAPQVVCVGTFLIVSWQAEVMKEQKLEYMGLWRQVGDRQGRCLVRSSLCMFPALLLKIWPVLFLLSHLECRWTSLAVNCSIALKGVSSLCLWHFVVLIFSVQCVEIYWNLLFKRLNIGITPLRTQILITGKKLCSVKVGILKLAGLKLKQ